MARFLTPGEIERSIRPLVDHLALSQVLEDEDWQGWRVARITGGQNNRLFRASNSSWDLAIKFTIRDVRERAKREYQALSALQQQGLAIAPKPILLDMKSYRQPVAVMTWVEGESSAALPTGDAEWEKLLEHLATIHTVRPDDVEIRLQRAVLNAQNADECKVIVQQELARIPEQFQPEALQSLIGRFLSARLTKWPEAPARLCRVDANILNFIRRPGSWASVDWENSGWGDPAFEIADLITHPAYAAVPATRQEWIVDTYCRRANEAATEVRIRTYHKTMLLWWAIRSARYLYEAPRGLDERLAARPAEWQADIRRQYEHYLGLAEAALA